VDHSKAIERDANLAKAYCDRGGANQLKGDVDGGIADFNYAIELNPAVIPVICEINSSEF
jgi:hypothetical protein